MKIYDLEYFQLLSYAHKIKMSYVVLIMFPSFVDITLYATVRDFQELVAERQLQKSSISACNVVLSLCDRSKLPFSCNYPITLQRVVIMIFYKRTLYSTPSMD
jgi:hypothetical protein